MADFRQEFIDFSIRTGVIRFGEFKTKAGRLSPYFFDAGLFNDGQSLHSLSQFYAKAVLSGNVEFDMLFGAAYKGIPLVAGTAIALAAEGHNYAFAFNRKETKDHGEGGAVVGAPLHGRVLIVDDVISAGTSVRESVEILRAHGAVPAGLIIALDRMERGPGELSAAQEVNEAFAIPVLSIAKLDDLLAYLKTRPELALHLGQVLQYREVFGTRHSGH